jgi:phosphatidylserine/phosphatidylglycerophosphate/cardiolipin synthase-like enzyme
LNITMHENWAEPLATDCSAARERIQISALSFSPPRKPSLTPFGLLWREWCNAVDRGLKVDIVIAAQVAHNAATLSNNSSAGFAAEQGITTRFVPPDRLMHAKSIVIDGRIIWIGSGNMTASAAHKNHEIYCRFESVEIAARIEARWKLITGT